MDLGGEQDRQVRRGRSLFKYGVANNAFSSVARLTSKLHSGIEQCVLFKRSTQRNWLDSFSFLNTSERCKNPHQGLLILPSITTEKALSKKRIAFLKHTQRLEYYSSSHPPHFNSLVLTEVRSDVECNLTWVIPSPSTCGDTWITLMLPLCTQKRNSNCHLSREWRSVYAKLKAFKQRDWWVEGEAEWGGIKSDTSTVPWPAKCRSN